jgi:hypothetical protein
MMKDGFVLRGFDGEAPREKRWSRLPRPFELGGLRPDAWGYRDDDQMIGFAEAKVFSDIDTEHTRKQLAVFGRTKIKCSVATCPLYVAVPRSAVYELDRVLIDVGLIRARNLVRLHIPDVLLDDCPHATR